MLPVLVSVHDELMLSPLSPGDQLPPVAEPTPEPVPSQFAVPVPPTAEEGRDLRTGHVIALRPKPGQRDRIERGASRQTERRTDGAASAAPAVSSAAAPASAKDLNLIIGCSELLKLRIRLLCLLPGPCRTCARKMGFGATTRRSRGILVRSTPTDSNEGKDGAKWCRLSGSN